MNNLVIFTAFLDNSFAVKDSLKDCDFVICTDGGYDIALAYSVEPDLLMGDFDSVTSALPEDVEILRFPPEKDHTDLELALMKAGELNAKNVTVIGGIGGRLDHTVANIQLLTAYADRFDSLILKDGKNTCFIIDGNNNSNMHIPASDNCYISIFSLSEQCDILYFSGVKYPLENYVLTRDFPIGVSNEFKEKEAALCIKSGTLLVVISEK